MFLSDRAIKNAVQFNRIGIEPYDESRVQPASIDLTLDRFFKVFVGPHGKRIDPREKQDMMVIEVGPRDYFELPSLGFCLGSTIERVRLPHDVIGRLEGKSSLGRLGLTAHVTAGFFDPGFEGHATLELFNASPRPIKLYPGMPICQMSFAALSSPAEKPYGSEGLNSKYQGQTAGPKESEMHRNFGKDD